MILADLKRKPVVGMADGAKIGEVADLSIDPQAWVVRGVIVEAKDARGALPLDSLKSIGPDAVTLERADLVAWNAPGDGLRFEFIKELIVVDGSGTNLGHVRDLAFERDGAIRSFEIHQGGVLGIGVKVSTLLPSQVRGLGDRLLTVDVAQMEPAAST